LSSKTAAGFEQPTISLMATAQRLLGEQILAAIVAEGFTDVRLPHGHVMAPLTMEDGLRLTDLAKGASIAPQSINELVDDLVAKGYVERRPDPIDGRAKRIHLTERGRANAEAGRKGAAESERQVSRILGIKGREQLRQMLLKLISECTS
jgi:DNA-binding MarR family transcriptional regulator